MVGSCVSDFEKDIVAGERGVLRVHACDEHALCHRLRPIFAIVTDVEFVVLDGAVVIDDSGWEVSDAGD